MIKRLLPFLLPLLLFVAAADAAVPVKSALRIGLTPVFLDDQASFISTWQSYIERQLGRPVTFVQRGSYHEIIDMLLDGKLDFAWLCSYPYVRNKAALRLVAVPLYQGKPYYRSYLIVSNSDRQTRGLDDLRGKIFAFSDPDSTAGYLYPAYQLAQQGTSSAEFFAKTFFTTSHRNVVEAVAVGLAHGGAVEGYVWDALADSHPELTAQTRVVTRSTPLGYPPFVAGSAASGEDVAALQRTLLEMAQDREGLLLLKRLNLDGFIRGNALLYDDIEKMYLSVKKSRINVLQKH